VFDGVPQDVGLRNGGKKHFRFDGCLPRKFGNFDEEWE